MRVFLLVAQFGRSAYSSGIATNNVDCFYRDDLIPKTIEHLQQVWK